MYRLRLWPAMLSLPLALALAPRLFAGDTPGPSSGLNAVFTLGGGQAPPGGNIELPFFIWTSEAAEGYSFSVDFEEEVLEAKEVEVVWERTDGLSYDFQLSRINNDNAVPGSHGLDEGFIYGASVFGIREPFAVMPAETDNLALRLHFAVNPETTASSTEVAFLDGQPGDSHEWQNVLTVNGDGIDLSLANSFIFLSGFVAIIDDIATFVRGDANGDHAVDMSDPIATLNFLFLGKSRLYCFDAADFDDNGRLDIADPIGMLTHLFQDGKPPPAPFIEEGEDPTPDAMTCLTR